MDSNPGRWLQSRGLLITPPWALPGAVRSQLTSFGKGHPGERVPVWGFVSSSRLGCERVTGVPACVCLLPEATMGLKR